MMPISIGNAAAAAPAAVKQEEQAMIVPGVMQGDTIVLHATRPIAPFLNHKINIRPVRTLALDPELDRQFVRECQSRSISHFQVLVGAIETESLADRAADKCRPIEKRTGETSDDLIGVVLGAPPGGQTGWSGHAGRLG